MDTTCSTSRNRVGRAIMGTWRQLAFEQFPELKSAIVPVETLVDLYCELSALLEQALDKNNSLLVQRIIKFVLWGLNQLKNTEPYQEQFLHNTNDLLGRIISSGTRRKALWRELMPQQFDVLKEFFIRPLCTKPDVPLDELEREFRLFKKPARPMCNRYEQRGSAVFECDQLRGRHSNIRKINER